MRCSTGQKHFASIGLSSTCSAPLFLSIFSSLGKRRRWEIAHISLFCVTLFSCKLSRRFTLGMSLCVQLLCEETRKGQSWSQGPELKNLHESLGSSRQNLFKETAEAQALEDNFFFPGMLYFREKKNNCKMKMA